MSKKKSFFSFVYPYNLSPYADKASLIRPYQMKQAFERVLGDSLVSSCGKKRFSNIDFNSLQGLYLESINRPFIIQRILEKQINIFSDYFFIHKLKKCGVKMSIFYRDGFWAGDFLYKQYPFPIAFFLRLFYKLEWLFIKHYFDTIYLPSLELAKYMGEKDLSRFQVLLPGCSSVNKKKNIRLKRERKEKFTFLYAGGILPPLNDLSLMLNLLGNRQGFELIMIIREDELKQCSALYSFEQYSNVDIVLSRQGDQLIDYYLQADATLLLYPYHSYRYLAMPFKAFESISYGLPLISFSDNVMGNFIKNQQLGISLPLIELDGLFDDPDLLWGLLNDAQFFVKKYAKNNTWENRAENIINDMSVDFQITKRE